MALDVFSASSDAPVASTSKTTLDDGVANATGEPTLAQLLQETVRAGARRETRASSGRSKGGKVRHDELQSLPSLPSLSSSTSRAYIGSLLAKDLPALLKEPDELHRQSEVLDSDLATLCYRSVGELLGVGDCVDNVENGFGKMESALDELLDCTEQLSTSCSAFTTSITPILTSRTRLNLVRSNIASIEDILSIPRLVSTCIRGGWWSEAMDLAFRARDLEDILKGPSTISPSTQSRRSLLGKVRDDVDNELKTLRSRIIEGVRGRGLKLPAAVRSISLLRRMSTASASRQLNEDVEAYSLDESQLRVIFLAARWDCLRSQLDQLEVSANSSQSSDDRLRYLKRWIEVWREVVGESITMYSEIFLSAASAASPSLTPSTPLAKPASVALSTSPLSLNQPNAAMTIFMSQVLRALEDLLKRQLPQLLSVAGLASLQTQLSYCSAAFSKFGFDFKFVPNQAIAGRLYDLIRERFDDTTQAFAKSLSRALTQTGSRAGRPRLIIEALIAAESWDSIMSLQEQDLTFDSQLKTSHAPAFIALFPPLAKLLNGYATAFNELRLMPIASLCPSIALALRQSFEMTSANMLQFLQYADDYLDSVVSDSGGADEPQSHRTTLRKLNIILCHCIVPWCQWALHEGVYPNITHPLQSDADSITSAPSLVKLSSLPGYCLEKAHEDASLSEEANTPTNSTEVATPADATEVLKSEDSASASSNGSKEPHPNKEEQRQAVSPTINGLASNESQAERPVDASVTDKPSSAT